MFLTDLDHGEDNGEDDEDGDDDGDTADSDKRSSMKSTMEKNNKQNFPNQRPQKVNSKEHQEFRAGLNEILTNVEVHVKSNEALTTDANRGHSSRNAHATNKMQ